MEEITYLNDDEMIRVTLDLYKPAIENREFPLTRTAAALPTLMIYIRRLPSHRPKRCLSDHLLHTKIALFYNSPPDLCTRL
jgi:hypothetical protein